MYHVLGAAALLLACIGCSMLPDGRPGRTAVPADYTFAMGGAAGS